ncbi:MAG: DUF2961 domain-containing protein [Abitibacteriaceae bacterium]|nr:DUF2961 domain-containing protein [Abditibacteriaceae bacterium]
MPFRYQLGAFLLAWSLLATRFMPVAHAQIRNPVAELTSPLSGLMLPHQGETMHEGSWDRKGGNADMRAVEPGQTIPLFDHKGAGIVHRFWVTIAPRSEMTIHRQAILRMYWDNEPTPSVEVPVGDFFGVGFGEQKDYTSLPLNEMSGGYNCYWPMPFHKSAHWTLTNLSKRRIDAFYYNIDYTAYKSLPKNLKHFHAQWRRENPTRPHQNYTILDATGDGHFVGTALFMQNRRGRDFGFLEGDEMIYVDGRFAVNGTGTEDYFSSGWYFDRGLYSAPYHGVTILDTQRGRVSAYRWHIEDAMPFHKHIQVTIEHGHANDHEADYSSVAYFYQSEPHAPYPPLPTNPDDFLPYTPPPPFKYQGAVEAESFLGAAQSSNGPVMVQEMGSFNGHWSGEQQLFWNPTKVGDTLNFNLPAPADGTYDITAYFTKARDYGNVAIFQDGREILPLVNLYDPNVVPSGPVAINNVTLKQGNNKLTMKIIGKDPRSTGYFAGIDAFVLKPR